VRSMKYFSRTVERCVSALAGAPRTTISAITQQDLASRLGKPQSFVSNYEIGQRRVDLLEFVKIAAAIGANPEKLFSRFMTAISKSKR
jgi:transcriptional regulator with XRE-family HTH domain